MNNYIFGKWYKYANNPTSFAEYMIIKQHSEFGKVIYIILCQYGGQVLNAFPYETLEYALNAMLSLSDNKGEE